MRGRETIHTVYCTVWAVRDGGGTMFRRLRNDCVARLFTVRLNKGLGLLQRRDAGLSCP